MPNTIMQTLNGSETHAHGVAILPVNTHEAPKPQAMKPTAEEIEFYDQYLWVLNALPTMREVLERLSQQLSLLKRLRGGWQQREVITNTFLLACSVTDTIDDYIAGNTYDFSKVGRAFPAARPGVRILNSLCAGKGRLREARLSRLRAWSEAWRSAVTDFLQHSMAGAPLRADLVQHCAKLSGLLPPRFPKPIWDVRAKIPAFFRSRDFAQDDCLELGRKFVDRFPACERPAIIIGLRTAGSFLAPLLCAYLRRRLPVVDWIAVRPKKGLALSERAAIRQALRRRARVLVIDESIHSGHTLITAIALLRRMGFNDDDIVVLNPAEPAFPDWQDSSVVQSVPKVHTITLEPAERYKQRLLDSDSSPVPSLLNEYFRANGYVDVSVMTGAETEKVNASWRGGPPERVDVRLKRLFDVHLRDGEGRSEVRHVVAKSVGWGWLGYHAFQTGRALAEFVPPILGLREGILFSEWLPQEQNMMAIPRPAAIEAVGSYVAARTRKLQLGGNLATDLAREGRHKGLEMLAGTLSRAYSSRIAAAAQRSRIQEKLSQSSGVSVLTDSKMSAEEWICTDPILAKTDFEHHGQGKNELGMTDPAYDLADAVFHFGFSAEEEKRLVDKYVTESGDADMHAGERLFLNKLLAGLWAQNLATLGLHNRRLVGQRDAFHRQYISAWNFLISQTVRECGKLRRTRDQVSWQSPLVVLDIDGVLDRMVFGFPSTTAAGIKALSLFASHGRTVALNTARTLREVKEYCEAYGLAGGVAEYGGVAWDRVTNWQVSLVDAESMRELEEARGALRRIPGVFLNEDYQYSLRAFTYQNGRTMPLPSLMAQDLLAGLKLNRLHVHHTGLDTAITAKETDKGKGLRALLALVGLAARDVTAVGDSEPDLAMFRVAGRSFAPVNVSCRKEAELLGCHVAKSGYQPGLLEIAQKIIHPAGGSCDHCRDVEAGWRQDKSLFVSLLTVADKKPGRLLFRHRFDAALLRVFRT